MEIYKDCVLHSSEIMVYGLRGMTSKMGAIQMYSIKIIVANLENYELFNFDHFKGLTFYILLTVVHNITKL